jgi:enediyne biosynthesis protein E4
LIFDMDNDGWKDIFVANGIFKDLLDQDYVNFIGNPSLIREMLAKDKKVIQRLVDSIPTNKIENYAFQNNKDLTFTNRVSEWGFQEPSHSNGSAYADLDNDGDLDLITSNVNMPSFIYENRVDKVYPERHNISVLLEGDLKNRFAIGARVTLMAGKQSFYQELNPMRGFMSSVDYRLVFGLGDINVIDSMIVDWPGGKRSLLKNVKSNQTIRINERDAVNGTAPEQVVKPLFAHSTLTVNFKHEENSYVDFDRDPLLFNMITNEGPCVCTGDVNADGKTDFYVGGAKGQAGALYVQAANGKFRSIANSLFEADQDSEDTDCVFFDANGDKKPDLYVTSGSYEFSSSSSALVDRLYFNKGNERFTRTDQLLPTNRRFESTSGVTQADFDGDGDTDLFVGVRVIPFLYGLPGSGYLLRNDGNGTFEDVTSSIAPELKEIGMITDARWTDLNNDSLPDLVMVGEWMPVKVFLNKNGSFQDVSKQYGFEFSAGWYHTVEIADVNKDGFQDIITGNHGLNSRFKAAQDAPLKLFVNDFDANGTVEHFLTRNIDGKDYPFALRNDLVKQIPSLKKKYLHYRNYAGQSVTDIFSESQLKNTMVLEATDLESSVWLNSGKGTFLKTSLPAQAQFSPIYSILTDDYDGDGHPDILMGGNLHRAKPEAGIYDASYGLLLKGDGNGKFNSLLPSVSGVFLTGEIRALKRIDLNGKRAVIVGRNNDTLKILTPN